MEEIERFTAVGDSGREYTVLLLANVTTFRDLKGNVSQLRGGTAYQLLDGSHVNMKDASTFQIFDTDEIIRKVG